MSGYSGTPLAKKLGIKESFRVRSENAPDNYLELLQPLSSGVRISNRLRTNIDIWHIFVTSQANLGQKLGSAMKRIPADGMIWVSWPKKLRVSHRT
jgi:hypothetical protein